MTRADVLVALLALILVGGLYAKHWDAAEAGSPLSIQLADGTHSHLPLDRDQTIAVEGTTGLSTVQILDGKVRFVGSPCPNKYCIHYGWLTSAGEVAACLPNGVALSIEGDHARFDAINF